MHRVANQGGTNKFKTDALHAIKLVARNLCDGFYMRRDKNFTKEQCAVLAAQEVYRRHPGFKRAWELSNNELWDDQYFIGRIQRQSSDRENKKSHMQLQEFVILATFSNDVFPTWELWESYVEENLNPDVQQFWHLYLLPLSYAELGKTDLYKVGVTTILSQRLSEYRCRCPRGITVPGVKLWPDQRGYLATCQLGKMTYAAAKLFEEEVRTALRISPKYGKEWFAIGQLSALTAVSLVAHQSNLWLKINDQYQ